MSVKVAVTLTAFLLCWIHVTIGRASVPVPVLALAAELGAVAVLCWLIAGAVLGTSPLALLIRPRT